MNEVTILFQPVGSDELELIRLSAFTEFPHRLPEQPIFYRVLNEEYAAQIARDWNTRYNTDGRGYEPGVICRLRENTDTGRE
jgi:hypothetical protein